MNSVKRVLSLSALLCSPLIVQATTRFVQDERRTAAQIRLQSAQMLLAFPNQTFTEVTNGDEQNIPRGVL